MLQHEGLNVISDLFRLPLVWITVAHHPVVIHEEFLKVPGQIGLRYRRPDDIISGIGQVGAGARTSCTEVLKNRVRVPAVHVHFGENFEIWFIAVRVVARDAGPHVLQGNRNFFFRRPLLMSELVAWKR